MEIDGFATVASSVGLVVIMPVSVLASLADALLPQKMGQRDGDRVWPVMKISSLGFSVENKEQTMYRLTTAELVRSVGIVQRDVK